VRGRRGWAVRRGGLDRGDTEPTFALGPGEDGGSRVPVLVAGNVGLYRRHWLVDLDTALRAARSFYEAGGFGGGGAMGEGVRPNPSPHLTAAVGSVYQMHL
jgi:hypothetical protein